MPPLANRNQTTYLEDVRMDKNPDNIFAKNVEVPENFYSRRATCNIWGPTG